MLRAPRLSLQCLACHVPLSGPLSLPARIAGIGRNIDNPNLCNRCASHLVAGQIYPAALAVLELGPQLHFGRVPINDLANEVPALIKAMRCELESRSAFIIPQDCNHPFRILAYFNIPIALNNPECRAFYAVQDVLNWLENEVEALNLNCSYRGMLASGFVEIINCEPPNENIPFGELSLRALELFDSIPIDQFAFDAHTFQVICSEDREFFNQFVERDPLILATGVKDMFLLPCKLTKDSINVQSFKAIYLSRREAITNFSQISALFFSLIAVPCAAMVILVPGATAVGLTSAIGVLLPIWKSVGMSTWPRFVITFIIVLVSALNWIRVEIHCKRYRKLNQFYGRLLRMPSAQLRQLNFVRFCSCFVLSIVFLEGFLRVFIMKMPLF